MAGWLKRNGTLVEATEQHVNSRWCGYPDNRRFRCAFCGHKFVIGDKFRAVYTNSTPGASGNPFVCGKCNASDAVLIEEWKQKHARFKQMKEEEFWWFFRK